MDVEITKMSSKGQVVIPLSMRKRLNAEEGTLFAVAGTSDSLVFKKVSLPSKSELIGSIKGMAKEASAILRREGMTDKDIIRAAARARGK